MKSCALLFTPPFPTRFSAMPCGLLEIATQLDEFCDDVVVFDLSSECDGSFWKNDDWQGRVGGILKKFNCDNMFVGISLTSPSVVEGVNLAEFIRKIKPEAMIAAGGAHLITDGDFFSSTKTAVFDWAYHGCDPLSDVVLNAIEEHRIPRRCYWVSYPGSNRIRHVIQSKGRSRRCSIPKINFSLLDDKGYYTFMDGDLEPLAERHATAQAITSVGCSYGCRFCVAANFGYRRFSLNNVRECFDNLKEQKKEFIFFDDPTFTLGINHDAGVLGLLRDYNFSWGCQTRIDQVDEKMIIAMKETGCKYIFFGVESGSKRIKRFIRKSIPNQKVLDTLKRCDAEGIGLSMSLIFGVPGETKVDVKASLDLISRIEHKIEISPSFYAVYPGTQAQKDLKSTQLNYIKGYNREKTWQNFDDGYGAYHHFSEEYALKIAEKLKKLGKNLPNVTVK